MGPPSYMRSIDRNDVMRRIPFNHERNADNMMLFSLTLVTQVTLHLTNTDKALCSTPITRK